MRMDDATQIHHDYTGGSSPMEPETDNAMSVRDAAKDIAFGSVAGMVSEVFEYPFDLAKVRLQSQMLFSKSPADMRFSGPVDCLKKTWRDEGLRGLYRGLPAPIVGSMAETAALFLAYSWFQNAIRSYNSSIGHTPEPGALTISQLGLAAAGAGFVTSFILTPIELVKCKMQVQMMNVPPTVHPTPRPVTSIIPPIRFFPVPSPPTSHSLIPSLLPDHEHREHHPQTLSSTLPAKPAGPRLPPQPTYHPEGPISIIRSTIAAHGIRGLWLGHAGTLLRETGGTAAWFSVKEWTGEALKRRRLSSLDNQQTTSLSVSASRAKREDVDLLPWESAVAGALAGAACVLALYPADTVKSAMQTEEELRRSTSADPGVGSVVRKARRYPKTFVGTFAHVYAAHGLRGLYAGCGMTVARAVPSSGIVFVVYDGLSAWFG